MQPPTFGVPSFGKLDRFCQTCDSLVQKINRQAIASAFLTKFGGVYVMKLNPDSIKEIDNAHPIELFRRGINDDETLSGYTSILKNALCTALEDVLHGTHEERAAEFVKIGKEDPTTARSIITPSRDDVARASETGTVRFRIRAPRDDQGELEPDQETNGHE